VGSNEVRPYDPKREIALAVRTGFLTKKVWLDFFATGKQAWRNRVWMNLIERGFFQPHYASRAFGVITPNARNPIVRRFAGDSIVQAPSIAVLDHDEIVMRSFLMLDSTQLMAMAKFESELKKEDLRNRIHYDPNDRAKFPDLLISLCGANPNRKIAIEVELSRKEPKRYRQVMNSYMTKKDVSKIIFVTDLDIVRNGIRSAIQETYFPDWEMPVGFVSLSEWIRAPQTALVHFSETSTTLTKMSADSNQAP
jgi:hypothetical protein